MAFQGRAARASSTVRVGPVYDVILLRILSTPEAVVKVIAGFGLHSQEEATRLVGQALPVTLFNEVGYGLAYGAERALHKKAMVQVQKTSDWP